MKRIALALFLSCLTQLPLAASAAEKQAQLRSVTPRGPLTADEKQVVDLFRRTSPAVVYITTLDHVINLFTLNVREVPRGTGTGIVWDSLGHIVTNYHVVAGARAAQVRLTDQRTLRAELVGVSPEQDLAVLRIKFGDSKPAPLTLGSSRDLQVGQRVYAIGNPFGFDHTLTTGVVSALDRSISDDQGNAFHHLIQTDAAINPGNSGGPLLDSAGRLIGVNASIYSPSGASAGIGFAIPVDTVNRIVSDIIVFGYYRRPVFGITSIERVSSAVTQQLGISGVLILDVEAGSPAQKVGLRGTRQERDGSITPGDVIQSIDGEAVDSVSDMEKLLDDKRIGQNVTLGLWRNGRKIQVEVTLVSSRR